MDENLKKFIDQSIKSLEFIKNPGAKEYSYDFDCSELDNQYLTVDITKSEAYKKKFDSLKEIKGPAVYWFEITSNTNQSDLVNALEDYSRKDNHRAVPVIKKTYCATSNYLYVGKVKKNFYSRIVQHLGYFKTAATQGLQLCHWGNNLSLKLKLHVIEFNRDMEDMMPAIEQHFAQVLKPLVGKHI